MADAATSVKDLFNVKFPEAIKNNPDKAKEINAIYLFKITGPEGGTWTVDCSAAGTPSCTEGDKGNAQCTLEVADSDFTQILTNPAMGMQLYFQGKLKVSGDPMLATKLQKVFSI